MKKLSSGNKQNLRYKQALKYKQAMKYKQKGTFAIEFALVGVFLAVIIAFSGDVIVKVSVKGKLDRLSYSIVSLAKEKTQLYGDDRYKIQNDDVDLLYTVAKNSLSRTIGDFESDKFGMIMEEQTYSGTSLDALYTRRLGSADSSDGATATCVEGTSLSTIEGSDNTRLSVLTTWGRMASVYRVTMCYETENYVGSALGSDFTVVKSSSVILGR